MALITAVVASAIVSTLAVCALLWNGVIGRVEKSRAVFFFSGHGMEISNDHQVLLPADYLAPPAENPNRALSPALRATIFVDAGYVTGSCTCHQRFRTQSTNPSS